MNFNDMFAKAIQAGFVELRDWEPANGSHYIRAAHITAVRPTWDKHEEWTGCDVFTLDGSRRRVNASFEQIAAAIAAAEGE